MREKPTPNADPEGAAPVVMHLTDGKTPYQAARHLLEGAERRNRNTVLCREIVLSASPNYFRPGRESVGGVFELDGSKRGPRPRLLGPSGNGRINWLRRCCTWTR